MRSLSSVMSDSRKVLFERATRKGGAIVPPSIDAEAKAICALLQKVPTSDAEQDEEDEERGSEKEASAPRTVPRQALVVLALVRNFLAVQRLEGTEDLLTEVGELVDAGRASWVPTFPPNEPIGGVDTAQLRMLALENPSEASSSQSSEDEAASNPAVEGT